MKRLFFFKTKRRAFLFFLLVGLITYLAWPLQEPDYPYSTVLNDRHGNLLGASIASDGQWRFPEPDTLPGKVATCIQYFEDRYFYRHPGVNPFSLVRALWQNARAGETVSGASTITMQIARMMHGRERTLWQKIREMGFATRLELKYSKDELMTKYLALAPFGGNVVGIDAASWRYFNRPSHSLGWGEAASLAVLPNNPGAIFPGRSVQKFRDKRDRLLHNLFENEVIDSLTYELSLLEELPGTPFSIPRRASHLLTTVQARKPGTITQTTLDPFWQSRSSLAVERHHKRLLANGVENACAIVIDLETGDVLAYVGNTNDPTSEGHKVDIIQKARSPGSSLKPLLYAHALHKGEILPNSLLPDIPTFFGGFSPKNFSGGYEGALPAGQALAKSLNIPFAYLLRDHSYEQFHLDLRNDGITTLDQAPGHYGLSLILGGGEVTLWDLATAYVNMYQTLALNQTSGISYEERKTNQKGLNVDPASIWYTFKAMTELSRPIGEEQWQSFSSSQLISWKTGTSYGFRDAWAVGLNGNILVGVWTGNADGEGRAGLTGIIASAPLLLEIMRLSDHDRTWLDKLKPVMQKLEVCTISGMLATDNCPSEEIEVPLNGENSGRCPFHRAYFMEEAGIYRVNSSCYSLATAEEQTHFVLPPTMGFYYAQAHPDYRGLPPLMPSCLASEGNPIEIIYPNSNSKVFIPVTLEGEKGRLILEASHQNSEATLFWSIGEEFYGKTETNHQLEVLLSKGEHVLKVTDENGNERRRRFQVVSEAGTK